MAPVTPHRITSARREASSVRQVLRQAKAAGVARPPPESSIDRQIDQFLNTTTTVSVNFPQPLADVAPIADLTAQLASATESRKAVQEENARLNAEITRLEAQLAAAQDAAAQLETQADGLRAALAEAERARDTARAEVDHALTVAAADSAGFQEQLRAREQEAATARAELAAETAQRLADVEAHYREALEDERRTGDELRARIAELERALAAGRESSDAGAAQLQEALATIARLRTALAAEEEARRTIHEAFMDLRGRIRCYCRIRPSEAHFALPRGEAGGVVALELPRESVTGRAGVVRREFQFDHVFAPDCGQRAVFDEVTHLVTSALDGFNIAIVAYGQTGSGKTFTMVGEPGAEGIVPRTAAQLFSACAARPEGWALAAEASVIEIYNGAYHDLLAGEPLQRPEDAVRRPVPTAEAFVGAVRRAMERRHVASTQLNEHSSRSHTLFQLHLRVTLPTPDGPGARCSTLTLVDLAGSERWAAAHGDGSGLTPRAAAEREARIAEMRHINSSLSALALVVQQLEAGSAHVSFRDNPLTRALQPSLGGEGKCCLLFCVGGGAGGVAESLNTLGFGQSCRARQPRGGPVANTVQR